MHYCISLPSILQLAYLTSYNVPIYSSLTIYHYSTPLQFTIYNLQFPSFKFQVSSFKFQVPSSKFQVPISKFQPPSSKLQESKKVSGG
ncbi:unnamed protein product [Ambrosiozyma monospora]|uniref:Unnamed protein product n=1 Tax=Ambrosiozyma monospora TaxID=43982 RepID=A0A9W6T4N4_AMBMO|nr:unnamed protein product [Ambrosiozyma monospora]